MKIRLSHGLLLLLLLLLGVALTEGSEQIVLIVAAMGVALWSAFSLPRPPPEEDPGEEWEEEGAEEGSFSDFGVIPPPEGSNGSGGEPSSPMGPNGGEPPDTGR